jgi:hypothetical protein
VIGGSVIQGAGLWIVVAAGFLLIGLLVIVFLTWVVEESVPVLRELLVEPFQPNGGGARLYDGVLGLIVIVIGEVTSQFVTLVGLLIIGLMVFLQVRFFLARKRP